MWNVCLAIAFFLMKYERPVPSEAEQEEAWEYVCRRELTRPRTNVKRALRYSMLFLGIDILVTRICGYLVQYFYQKSGFIDSTCSISLLAIIFFIITSLGLLAVSKKTLIGLVRLYQRYAPERIRRKCLFKPTCSEYMILALEKHGLIKGLYKGCYRMFFRCKGFYYSIDYP
jgi:putative component of membrane protein insertase Oxa1/YidC/SpoIIIJ protein YidD